MDDLHWVEIMEKLRGHVVINGLTHELSLPAPSQDSTPPLHRILRHIFSAVKGCDELSPIDERRIRYLAAGTAPNLAPPDPDFPLLIPVAADLKAKADAGTLEITVREMLANPQPEQAAVAVRKHIPLLKKDRAYRFLQLMGYSMGIPTESRRRFVGQFDSGGSKGATAKDYQQVLRKIRRLTETPETVTDKIFAYFTGDLKSSAAPEMAICLPKTPRCQVCPVKTFCRLYSLADNRDFTSIPVSAPPKNDRLTRPIKDWMADERPRERMLAGERLTPAELLAVILRTGSGKLSAVDLARAILQEFGSLHELEKASPQQIIERMKGMGIGPAKAVEIKAAIELGRRTVDAAEDPRKNLSAIAGSRDIFNKYRTRYKTATQEEFLLVILNTKHKIQKEVSISVGTLNSSIVHPRDVYHHALREAAAAVIFVHNHPSGDPTPSPEDFSITKRLAEAGTLLGMRLLDHIIIGSHDYYSFADNGTL